MMVQVKPATEPEAIAARPRRILRRLALATGLFVLVSFAVGFVAASLQHGHGLTGRHGAIVAVAVLLAVGLGWLLVREMRTSTGEEPLTRQERLNRNLVIASGVLGGLTAFIIMMANRDGDPAYFFSNAPIPRGIALAIILLLGIAVPVIAYFWHRNVDEQEADAYKTGALYGFYVYALGAPLWWFAARGGLLPPPDGFIIYYATVLVVGAVWMWKKYR